MSDERDSPIDFPSRYDRKIHVRDLRTGMYVTRLDRDWLETPFLLQGFLIHSANDVEEVAKYCEYVWVHNTEIPFAKDADMLSQRHASQNSNALFHVSTPIAEEHSIVRKLFSETSKYTQTMMEDVRLGRAIEEKKARVIVDKNVQSVMRNPDALAWMTKMRSEDSYTAEHSLSVCILALIFGRSLGFKEPQLSNLGLCGLLHDVGKIRVPIEILNKPSRLTDKEMKIMQAHAAHGRKLLSESKNMYEGAIDVAYCHHERPDGKGYPQGLPSEDISLFSKIISIVDSYDAMTCERVYAQAKPSTEALKIIYEERGKQFDENLALAFIQTIGLYPPGSIVELHNGCVGVVVETNVQSRHLPKVLIMRDEEKLPCTHRLVDLATTLAGELSSQYQIKTIQRDGYRNIYLRECFEKGYLTSL
ncbi:HD-GYP domain-containing protein [Teredinibacter waterburyi]|uniref:HD-GYP domain-containing protein n=1 Tax=Teredinibacter waterburyi TaxID=1500538 RepID=UPI00165F14B0|nr:HD-GYP domain-containing protein [Teredinibacter waterburyi]